MLTKFRRIPISYHGFYYGAIFGLPWLFLGWVVFGNTSIGQDYIGPQVYQAIFEYRNFLKLGYWPMWDHSIQGGVPSGQAASAQIFHFPHWLLTLFPSYWSGGFIELIAVQQILLASLAMLWIFVVLRSTTSLSRGAALAISLICTFNSRVLDNLRHGIAFDAFIYGQSLLVLLLWMRRKEGHRPERSAWLAMIVLAYLFLTAGYYPYFIVFGYFGLALVLWFLIVVPENRMLGLRHWTSYLLFLFLGLVLAICLAAPNLLPFLDNIRVNFYRAASNNINWSHFSPLYIDGFVQNFVRPWWQDVHNGFGGSSLIGLVFVFVGTFAVLEFRALVPLLLIAYALRSCALGKEHPIFVFLYEHAPGFSMMRGPGRILIFLWPLLIFFVWGVFRKSLPSSLNRETKIRWATRAAAVFSIFIILKWGLREYEPLPGGPYWLAPLGLQEEFWTPLATRMIWLGLGLATAVLFFWIDFRSEKLWPIILLLTTTQTYMCIRYGTWELNKVPTPSLTEIQTKVDYLPMFWGTTQDRADVKSSAAAATEPYVRFVLGIAPEKLNCYGPFQTDALHLGRLNPFLFTNQVRCSPNQEAMFSDIDRRKCGANTVHPAYLLEQPCQNSGWNPEPKENTALIELNKNNRLLGFTTNRIRLQASLPEQALLTTLIPKANNFWSATIDGAPVPVESVNGSFVGVKVPKGEHEIILQYYTPAVAQGILICLWGVVLIASALLFLWPSTLPLNFRFLLVTTLFSLSVLISYRVEPYVKALSEREVSLNHSYDRLLKAQLERWRGKESLDLEGIPNPRTPWNWRSWSGQDH